MQLRLKLTDSCLYFLYTDVKWCVLLYIISLYCTNVGFFWRLRLLFFLFSLSFVYLGCSEGILHVNYWSSSSGFFFYYFFFVRVDEHVI